MFGRRRSHPNYRGPVKIKYRPSVMLIIALIALVCAAGLIIYILFFYNKGGGSEDGKEQQNVVAVIPEERELTAEEKSEREQQAREAAEGFMEEFCDLSIEGMSEYCNKDIAGMLGCTDFESYVDGYFTSEDNDKALNDTYKKIADIIVDCARDNMEYSISDCTVSGDRYIFDVTLEVPEYWDEVLDMLSVSGRRELEEQVVEENEKELADIDDKEQLDAVLQQKIYDKIVENIRKICKDPEIKSVNGKITVREFDEQLAVDADNSDLRIFIDSLINA